jgi:hypothetical protein
MEANNQFLGPAALPPGKFARVTRWIGGWVGPRTELEDAERRKISCLYQELDRSSSVVQLVAYQLYRLNYRGLVISNNAIFEREKLA